MRAECPVGEQLQPAALQPIVPVAGVPPGLDRPRHLGRAEEQRHAHVLATGFVQVVPPQSRGDAVEVMDPGQPLGEEELLSGGEAFDLLLAAGFGNEAGDEVGGVLAHQAGELPVVVADEAASRRVGGRLIDSGDLEGVGVGPQGVQVE